jgi:hypothetical protein
MIAPVLKGPEPAFRLGDLGGYESAPVAEYRQSVAVAA